MEFSILMRGHCFYLQAVVDLKLSIIHCDKLKLNHNGVEPQNVRNFPYPVRIRWIKLSNLATFIYITGYLNVRKISERLLFRTFIGALLLGTHMCLVY